MSSCFAADAAPPAAPPEPATRARPPPPEGAHVLALHRDSVLSVAWDERRGLLFSGGQDGDVRVWEADVWECARTLEGHSRPVLHLLLDPERLPGLLVSCGSDNTVRVWDVEAGSCLVCLGGFRGKPLTAAALPPAAPGGAARLAVGCQDTTVVVVALDGVRAGCAPEGATREARHEAVLREHTGFVYALAASDDGSLLFSASGDSDVRVWEVRGAEIRCAQVLDTHRSSVVSLAARGRYLFSGGHDGDVRVWSLGGSQGLYHCARTLAAAAPGERVASIMVGGGALYTADTSGAVSVWDLDSFRCLGAHAPAPFGSSGGGGPFVMGMCASERHAFLATTDSSVKVWRHGAALGASPPFSSSSSSSPAAAVVAAAASSSSSSSSSSHSSQLPPVADLLALVGASDLEPAFAAERVDTAALRLLTDADLTALGVPLGVRRRLVAAANSAADAAARVAAAAGGAPLLSLDGMVDVLRRFVAIPSVSPDPAHKGDCWHAAKFLRRLVESVGMETRLMTGRDGKNPLVVARLAAPAAPAGGSRAGRRKPRKVVLYGHYDVVPVGEGGWETPPFVLSGRNAHLYGRGSTDNKGPIVAMVAALQELVAESDGDMPVEVAAVFEGEEENDSLAGGFAEGVRRNLDWLGGADAVVIANSYWLGDTRPCLVYGMRGYLRFEVAVSGPVRDVHSGVHGGVFSEPMTNLVALLERLQAPGGEVRVPGFYDAVAPLTDEEEALYDRLEFSTAAYRETLGVSALREPQTVRQVLMRRWRHPSLSIHAVGSSASNSSVIAREAVAQLSVRVVPNQRLAEVKAQVERFVRDQFAALGSANTLRVSCTKEGDWWLGDPTGAPYRAAGAAVREVWGVEPMLIREGGSMPTSQVLRELLGAAVVHIPFGQQSDQAHLENERIRITNLVRGKDVLKSFLRKFGEEEEDGDAGTGAEVGANAAAVAPSPVAAAAAAAAAAKAAAAPPTSSGELRGQNGNGVAAGLGERDASVFPVLSAGQRVASDRHRASFPALAVCEERDARGHMAPMNTDEAKLAAHVIGRLQPASNGFVDAYEAAARQWMYVVGQGWEVHGIERGAFRLRKRGSSQLRKFLASRQAAKDKKRKASGAADADDGGLDDEQPAAAADPPGLPPPRAPPPSASAQKRRRQ